MGDLDIFVQTSLKIASSYGGKDDDIFQEHWCQGKGGETT